MPSLAVRELDIEVDLDTSEVIAVLGLGVVTGAADFETLGLGSFDGNGVHIHGCASRNRDQQQLDRRELPALGVAERQSATARVARLEVKPAEPREMDRAARITTHALNSPRQL